MKKHSVVYRSIKNKLKEVGHNKFLHQLLDNSVVANVRLFSHKRNYWLILSHNRLCIPTLDGIRLYSSVRVNRRNCLLVMTFCKLCFIHVAYVVSSLTFSFPCIYRVFWQLLILCSSLEVLLVHPALYKLSFRILIIIFIEQYRFNAVFHC